MFSRSVLSAVCLAVLAGCAGSDSDSSAPSDLTPVPEVVKANAVPVSRAGSAQSVLRGSLVTLDGSTSSDADNDTLIYAWALTAKPAGSSAVLSSTTSAQPTFTADTAGTYVATLVVNDGSATSAVSTVTVTASVANAAPVANAGVAQSVVAGSLVTFNGSASSDANGDLLTYAWTLTSKPAGSAAALCSTTVAAPALLADVPGTYVATLVVNDGLVNSAASTVTITASAANAAPVANAGLAQSVVAGNLVTFNGSASSDANGDPLTYAWTLTSKPAGSSAALSLANTVQPTLIADAAGIYVATLVVNDGLANSAASTVTITASVANAAPVANAGVAQSVVAGNLVTLNGIASSDVNGDPLTYVWTLASKPAGSAAALSSTTAVTPTLLADVAGTYVASLVVNDGRENSAASTVTITASVANAAPVADAGVAQSVEAGSLVTFDGSASSDANGDPLTYAWTLTTKPAGSSAVLSSATSVRPTFIADVAGTYVASLVVSDGKITGNTSTVTVTAAATKLTLTQPSDSIFGGTDRVLSLPYASSSTTSTSVSCVGSSCPTVYDVATYKLSATGRSFTITNVQAVNLTAGSTITPSFSGLATRQVISNGSTVSFKLQSPFTRGTTVNLRYSFTVLETGENFSHEVRLVTN